MSNHSTVANTAGISDLGLCRRLELLQLKPISRREWPSRKVFERTELGERASVD